MQQYKLKIKDWPLEERPRERLIKEGPKALSDAELLAIILRNGSHKENVLELSKRVLNNYDLRSLSRKRINTLKKQFGIGDVKACQIIACFELGRRLAAYNGDKQPRIHAVKDAARLVMHEISDLKKEQFIGIYLDSRNKILRKETIFIGSLNATVIHPREVFHIAIAESAAKIILAHNHPSGEPTPSEEDIKITKQLINAGKILGIELIEHIIIGGKKYTGVIEREYLTNK